MARTTYKCNICGNTNNFSRSHSVDIFFEDENEMELADGDFGEWLSGVMCVLCNDDDVEEIELEE